MPDISMCFGGKCKIKTTCYRWRAEPDPMRQTWFKSPPYTALAKHGRQACAYYWALDKTYKAYRSAHEAQLYEQKHREVVE